MATKKKKITLISFLNTVINLHGNQRIAHISITNPYQLPILPNTKTSIIDIKATDKNGNTFIVEMQVADVNLIQTWKSADWVLALALLWGCPLLCKAWKAKHHPQKDRFRVKRGRHKLFKQLI